VFASDLNGAGKLGTGNANAGTLLNDIAGAGAGAIGNGFKGIGKGEALPIEILGICMVYFAIPSIAMFDVGKLEPARSPNVA
jgi:hypothetical protein